jgi:hypothetical protein
MQLCQDILQEIKIWDTNFTQTIFLFYWLTWWFTHEGHGLLCYCQTKSKGIPTDSGRRLRVNQGDITTTGRADLIATAWKDKQNVNMLTNMHCPPADGNFCNEHGNALKQATAQDCNRHVSYAEKSDHMMTGYFITRCTWKWMKKLFFYLLDLSILNSHTYQDFRLALVRDLWRVCARVVWCVCFLPQPQTIPCSRPTTATSQPTRIDVWHYEHWLSGGRRVCCHVCSIKINKCGQNSADENATWSYVFSSASGCTTQNCSFEDCPTLHQ